MKKKPPGINNQKIADIENKILPNLVFLMPKVCNAD
tara:strand:+ start:592 stop:699 length:108 start_codon:yes stop_codon:yes gene_type:complete